LQSRFFVNFADDFAFGVVLGALLRPPAFGRYDAVASAAVTLTGAAFGWLRLSSRRLSGEIEGGARIAASLDAGCLGELALLYLGVVVAALSGVALGASLSALLLTPFLAVAFGRVDHATAQFRARYRQAAFAALSGLRRLLRFAAAVAAAAFTRDSTATIAALAVATPAAARHMGGPKRSGMKEGRAVANRRAAARHYRMTRWI